MAETILRLDGPDGNGIYGRLCKGGNRRLVVHVHGLTHYAIHLLEVTGGEFFEANGFDHYRMSLYDRPKDSRKLPQSTITTHGRDIEAVLAHFRAQYDDIFITTHSLGALATLVLNPAGIRAMSLWDPSFDVANFWAAGGYLTHVPQMRVYHLDYGNVFVLGEDMVEEIKKLPDEACLKLAAKVVTPTQFVIPEESIFLASPRTSPEKYGEVLGGPFDLRRIKGANHTFSNRGNRQALFEATLDWFENQGGGKG